MNTNAFESAAKSDQRMSDEVAQLEQMYRQQIYRRTDRLFAGLMAFQWVAGIFAAFVISPRTWIGVESQVHFHVWVSVLLGGAISFLPIAFAITRPGKPLTRHVIAAGQMLMSALLIHLCGGRIETHFHIFGSLAFLAFYRDWKVLITATVVIAADHFWRGIYWPLSVFGVPTASPWRWLEHAAWVVFEDIFLIFACLQGVREVRDRARRETQLTELSQSRAAEAAVKAAQEARLQAVLDSTADAIVTISEEGIIRSINKSTQRLFGYTEGELLGRSAELLSSKLGEEINRVRAGELPDYEDRRVGNEREVVGKAKDGSTFPAMVRVTNTRYDTHRLYIATIQDISLRKKAEQERLELFDAIRETAHHLSRSSAKISATMTMESKGAERDASTVSRTAAVVQEAAQTAENSQHLATEVAQTAKQADEVSKSGRKAIEETRVSMNQVRQQVESTTKNILILAEKAQMIGEIIGAVKDVAEQTNILSLNAAVEASHAGQAGLGFAVVAREVKLLAQQATNATAQVRDILHEILQATHMAVASTEQGTHSVGAANDVVAKAETTINELGGMVSQATRTAAQIVSASNKQAASMNQVAVSMEEIDQTAKKSLLATKETQRAATDLNSLGIRLKRLVEEHEMTNKTDH